jgi:spore maturation protein CgeB
MYQVLARARIAINRHIDVAERHANNMRLYESTGVGTMLITESFANLGEHFEPGREVATYEGAGDLAEHLGRYLSDDAERQRVAAAGQQRTLREHTYAQRMEELVAMIEPRLKR